MKLRVGTSNRSEVSKESSFWGFNWKFLGNYCIKIFYSIFCRFLRVFPSFRPESLKHGWSMSLTAKFSLKPSQKPLKICFKSIKYALISHPFEKVQNSQTKKNCHKIFPILIDNDSFKKSISPHQTEEILCLRPFVFALPSSTQIRTHFSEMCSRIKLTKKNWLNFYVFFDRRFFF